MKNRGGERSIGPAYHPKTPHPHPKLGTSWRGLEQEEALEVCRKTGSDCRKWVPLFIPPPPPGQQLTSLLWRPSQPPAPTPPSLGTCGQLGSSGSQIPCLGRPGSCAGMGAEVQRWQGNHLPACQLWFSELCRPGANSSQARGGAYSLL